MMREPLERGIPSGFFIPSVPVHLLTVLTLSPFIEQHPVPVTGFPSIHAIPTSRVPPVGWGCSRHGRLHSEPKHPCARDIHSREEEADNKIITNDIYNMSRAVDKNKAKRTEHRERTGTGMQEATRNL